MNLVHCTQRINQITKMLTIFWLIVWISPAFYAASITSTKNRNAIKCGEHGDCLSISTDCNNICGCDNFYYFNDSRGECVLNIEYFKNIIFEKYNTEEKIRKEAEKLFNGIIISVILFITCASVCALTACVYCCRISYIDQQLRSDVKALAEKLNREGKLRKSIKRPTQPIAESCNVVDVDGGVFVC